MPTWRNPLVRLAVWLTTGQLAYWVALIALDYRATLGPVPEVWPSVWRLLVGILTGAVVLVLTARWFTLPDRMRDAVTGDASPSGADGGPPTGA